MGGGMIRPMYGSGGSVAKGCGKVMSNRRKKTKGLLMAKKGLRAWVKENWVDIANKRSDGSYPKCGRSGGEKRKNYPKCVPIAKARRDEQRATCGCRKKKTSRRSNTGPTPSRAATFAPKRKKMSMGGLV